MKKFIICLLSIVALGFFISSFIEKDVSQKVYNDNLIVFSVNNIPNDLEKITDLTTEDENIICATSLGLVKINSDGEIEPSLAKEYTVSDDGIEYNFVLDNTKCWSDGNKIKADDIIQFFSELIKYEDASNIEAALNIYGARDFRQGNISFNNGVAITSVENTIKIRLNEKDDNFLNQLTKVQYRIRKNLLLWGDIKENYSKIKYSGEYIINQFNEEEIYLKSENNSNEDIKMIKDDNVEGAMALYEIGDRDIVINPPSSELASLSEGNKNITFKENKGIYIYMNIYSLNEKKEILERIYTAQNKYSEDNTNVFEASEGSYFRADKEDLEKLQSRKVSISLGDVEEELPSKLSIVAVDLDEVDSYCRMLKKWFLENENIEINYTLVSEDELQDEQVRDNYDLVIVDLVTDNSDRANLFKEMKLLSKEEWKELFSDDSSVEENLFSQCDIVPGVFLNKNMAISDKINSITFDGNGNIDFSNIE